MAIPLLLPLLVLVLSVFFSILGLGGASIYVPLFVALGMPLESAVLAGLFVNVVTTAVSSFNFHRHGLLRRSDYRTAAFIFVGTLVGVPLGAVLAHVLDARLLVGLLALVLAVVAVRMLRPPARAPRGGKAALEAEESGILETAGERLVGISLRRGAMAGPAAGSVPAGAVPAAIGRSAALGGGTGLLSGSLGIGGGVFLVPALVESGVPPRRAAVLSHVCTLLASLLGLLVNLALGSTISAGLLLPMGAAAAVGSAVGSLALARGRVNDTMIIRAFVVLLAIFALKMAFDFVFWSGAPGVVLD